MRSKTFALVAAAACASLVGAASASAKATDVFVTNTASNPVPAQIVGTPSVQVANLPAAPAPFQVTVQIPTTFDPTSCVDIPTPAGRLVTIHHFAFFGTLGQADSVLTPFLRVRSGSTSVPAPYIAYERDGIGVRGQLQTMLYAGDVGGVPQTLDFCVLTEPNATFRGVVTGTVL